MSWFGPSIGPPTHAPKPVPLEEVLARAAKKKFPIGPTLTAAVQRIVASHPGDGVPSAEDVLATLKRDEAEAVYMAEHKAGPRPLHAGHLWPYICSFKPSVYDLSHPFEEDALFMQRMRTSVAAYTNRHVPLDELIGGDLFHFFWDLVDVMGGGKKALFAVLKACDKGLEAVCRGAGGG